MIGGSRQRPRTPNSTLSKGQNRHYNQIQKNKICPPLPTILFRPGTRVASTCDRLLLLLPDRVRPRRRVADVSCGDSQDRVVKSKDTAGSCRVLYCQRATSDCRPYPIITISHFFLFCTFIHYFVIIALGYIR